MTTETKTTETEKEKGETGLIGKEGFFSPSLRAPEKKPVVDLKEVEKLLRLVVEGEQDEAEKLVKEKPELLLEPGKVTDLSGRTFESVTAFQYAVWALDWHMWKMVLKHLPKKAAAEQYDTLESKGLGEHGKQSTHIEGLIEALKEYIKKAPEWKYDARAANHWQTVVGGAQCLLPVHVVNEYCHPMRSFGHRPKFLEDVLPRTRETDGGYDWFTATYNGGCLGEKFAVYRGSRPNDATIVFSGKNEGGLAPPPVLHAPIDAESLKSLFDARAQQRKELVATLTSELGAPVWGCKE